VTGRTGDGSRGNGNGGNGARRPGGTGPAGSRGPARPQRPQRPHGRQQPVPPRMIRINDARRRPGPPPARPAAARRVPPPPLRPALRCVGPGRRLNATLLVVAFVMSVFAGRLFQIQGLDSARYATAAEQQQTRQILIPAVRGSITASNGTVLALTEQTDNVIADPKEIPAAERAVVAARLAGPLGESAALLLVKLDAGGPGNEYAELATGVPQSTASRITAMNLAGLTTEPTYSTLYPSGDLASDIVGFTNYVQAAGQSQGLLQGEAGLEAEYNSLLAGRNGTEEVETGTDGEPIPLTEEKSSPVVPGESLRLTINSDIQFAAEQECKERVATYHARNCSIIVMQPHTGAILAMAQWPTYNPADVTNMADTVNIGTDNVFAPGSTLKSVTVAAALEKGHQTPMTPYTIPYSITVDGYPFHDAEEHPTVRYTVAGILAHSSNVGMVQVVQHITPMQQYDYLRAFGIGSPSGLNMPDESAGLLAKPGAGDYYGDSPYEYSFGQGVAVTAIQMASVYATIANGGVRVQPTLVAGTTTRSGAFRAARPSPSRRVIQPRTARELMKILEQVPGVDAQAGEGYGVIDGYPVAAKTGTAQVSDPSKSKCDLCQYGSSYIGIAPADNPQLVVAVNIQDPQGTQYFGDEVAGPAFYDVMRFALETMNIPPDYAKTPYVRLTAPW
jgi:cell division protein FtsI (penicillin-binding protein 3)